MKRIEKIYDYILKQSETFDIDTLKEKIGLSSTEISENLNILRNNVSMELNELSRQGKIIKIRTRPVLYIDKKCIERLLGKKLSEGPIEIKAIDEIIGEEKEVETIAEENSPFDRLIGASGSLRNQIEQAKAAILYPPNGLHTLIVGQTGVGKTLFANMMYNQAKYVNRLSEDAPFIVFNCADYYNNPQLLISHLFGHIKGAYTGADSEKAGIVEKANRGILFLDEIHRLPPEGQEMLFYFMDTGKFNRLGETERNRESSVLIIGATTEDPNSSLLKTFIRRIPIIITIPSFEKRSIKDKVDLIKFLISNEAHRVNKVIKIEDEAVKAIIGSTSYGNIGQMKSNIQLVCATAFLKSINNKDYIEINFKSLPSDIKSGLFHLSGKRKEMEAISEYLDSQIIITPEGHNMLIDKDPYDPPFNLYKIIEDKAAILKDGGADDEYINNFITTDINVHIKSFYNKVKNDEDGRNKILKIVDEDILDFSEEVMNKIEKKLKRNLNDRFLYALSLHLSSFLNRLSNHKNLKYTNIEGIINDKRTEFNIAVEIKGMLEKRYDVVVPKIEVIYLTLLISSITEEQTNQHVAIIVAAHGSSTASSMVNVTKQLLGEGVIEAIDMPLEVNPTQILDDIIEKAREIDMGKGILLLVDMGSLANFDSIIMEKTDLKVKTIDMVTTSLVLEAVRKANILDMDLDSIYNTLKDFRGYSSLEEETENHSGKKNVIVTICSTGEGTAVKLKELVTNIVTNTTKEEIEILPVSVKDINNTIRTIKKKHNIIASVGIVNPNIDAPFISLEELISGQGENVIMNIIQKKNFKVQGNHGNIVAKDLCEDSLNQFLTYLNPSKIISVLYQFVSVLEEKTKINFNNATRIRIMVHIGCSLERMVIRDGLKYKGDITKLNSNLVKIIEEANIIFKESLNISLNQDEIYYLSEMIE
ncbi:Transcriptional regulatory protein LevR, contains PRD, AAA+ and EIIA domains [Clostridium acidisoli DSM 12555]|uniref:Transcriptional regulatory protein LevR, contains PRD, AAA+ and EIIA domains n=1 Tax=Clostridium acidisoli DSM 12555 TaxID=1121291 RepID=A0A1W1X8Q6_9CLOT|nr:sigma-54-dependent transcriptional regulator [Clostridium acidisoli]SMC20058.1 Transcriptional regulatory protein LevR, contains PRD, AAA+ and EIIA domains [Clostridium acidisoli DSM 12555]